jgi:peptide/nickel transport system ATP-binding protein
MATPLVETIGLKKYFKTSRGMLRAVDDVNLKIPRGETLGVVGESGCGKSTLGRTILRLQQATAGKILYDGENILTIKKREMGKIYQNMQMVFQDPYSSLDPRMSVKNIIAEPLQVLGKGEYTKKEIDERVQEIMELCGLPPQYDNVYPHELDGGRRQRVGLARAMIVSPKFIVCDEPVSALDVSIQAQILNLLMDLQEKNGLSYMFITHDLCVVKHISTSIMVMYMGHVVEYAKKEELFQNPQHPYTKALLLAIPTISLSHRNRVKQTLTGEVSSPINPAPGCRFEPRCPYANENCKRQYELREVSPEHFVSCNLCW